MFLVISDIKCRLEASYNKSLVPAKPYAFDVLLATSKVIAPVATGIVLFNSFISSITALGIFNASASLINLFLASLLKFAQLSVIYI